MNGAEQALIRGIRKFNRFYTKILGLLDQHMLDSEFSLSEARVLYEIGHGHSCTAKWLSEELSIDPGYLSRMLKRFEKNQLIYKVQSEADGRLHYLHLSERGKNILADLDRVSEKQVQDMIRSVPKPQQQALLGSMSAIESALTGQAPERSTVTIRSELKPGDVGTLIRLHGWIYAQECGYNEGFEGYVCKTFADFFANYSPDKDQFWFAEVGGEMVGAIAAVGQSADKVQLRWFILHPRFRGLGLGRSLFQNALQYCRDKGYQQAFLATTEDQQTAIRMYQKAGFIKVAEFENHTWGKKLVEQMYELNLS